MGRRGTELRGLVFVWGVIALGACAAVAHVTSCSPSASSPRGVEAGSPSPVSPCDPLSPPPTRLGTILGVGKDTQSILYVADEAPDASSPGRVFVSDAGTLERQNVAGTGQSGGTSYSFLFAPRFAPEADLRSLLIETSGGVATTMELGPPTVRDPRSAADASEIPLVVLDAGAVTGLPIDNLPYVVEHVADISDGHVLVVVEPMDIDDTTGTRLFYGTQSAMVEYRISSVEADDSGQYVSFARANHARATENADRAGSPRRDLAPGARSNHVSEAGARNLRPALPVLRREDVADGEMG